MSLFRFGFTLKSLDTVTKREDIQATQQLNSTKLKEPGDKRKAESQPEVLAPCSLEMVPLGVLPFRPMLKVKLTSSVLKQTLLRNTQVPHL